MSTRRLNPIYLIILVFLLGIFVARLPATIDNVTGRYEFWDPMIDVYTMLSRDHVEEWDDELNKAVQEGAINGMIEALEDPYAQYIPPDDQRDFEKGMTGEFVGIGAEVRMGEAVQLDDGTLAEGGYLLIASPLEDSPAYKAGIMAGDFITHIDGESTIPLTVDDCIDLLQGVPGTPVVVSVERDGEDLGDFTILREKIVVRAVRGVTRKASDDGHFDYIIDAERRIAYFRLTQFIPKSADEFIAAVKEVQESGGVGGIIIDLRGNLGGVLDAALAICDLFIDDGALVSVRGRNQADETVHKARKSGTLEKDIPVAVLVNGASASASEILAGALQDYDRAIVVGTRTFGKGLVQTVRGVPTSRGGQLKFTAQRYYLPSGRLIQREDDSSEWGVDPDPGFYLPVTDELDFERRITRRELDILRREGETVNGESSAPVEERWSDLDWIRDEMHDPQLASAVRSMRAKIDSGEWERVSEYEAEFQALSLDEQRRIRLAQERLLRNYTSLSKRLEALEEVTGEETSVPEEYDLWDDEIELDGGTLEVRDGDGKLVATLDITSGDLERWLLDAPVEIAGDEEDDSDG